MVAPVLGSLAASAPTGPLSRAGGVRLSTMLSIIVSHDKLT